MATWGHCVPKPSACMATVFNPRTVACQVAKPCPSLAAPMRLHQSSCEAVDWRTLSAPTTQSAEAIEKEGFAGNGDPLPGQQRCQESVRD